MEKRHFSNLLSTCLVLGNSNHIPLSDKLLYKISSLTGSFRQQFNLGLFRIEYQR